LTETPFEARVADASHVLVLGIGGGGDAVGAIAVARRIEAIGARATLGGVAWERFPVDPYPGPRPLADVHGARAIGEHAALIDPATGATTPEGAHFCESRVAQFLGNETVLIDVAAGAEGAAEGIAGAAAALDCDLVMLVDIGGDAIAAGTEPGLASPLCDAVMIAGGLDAGVPALLGVLGAGCDGELLPGEVLERTAALARCGAWLGAFGVAEAEAAEIEAAAEVAVTEASLMVARCFRGGYGETPIRGGRRMVELSPVGALCLLFDPEAALPELPLVRAVAGSASIAAGRDALAAVDIRTELDYERERAAAA
jgi:hypothetical protein